MKLEVKNSPFTEEQVKILNQLLPQLTEQQSIWLTGYLSATTTTLVMDHPAVAKKELSKVDTKTATILYGSQTGNSQRLAEKFAKELEQNHIEVTLSSLSKFKPNTLKKISTLLLVVSTHGEGDPPDNALQFYNFIHSKRAPKLNHLQYAVLALGDSSYEFFCQTGKDFDTQFEKLGAKRLVPRVDCDLDYEEPSKQWFEEVKKKISTSTTTKVEIKGKQKQQDTTYSKENPYYAEVLEKINLNGRESNKETYHLELSIEGSNFHFEPGDSIGIFPENDEKLVDLLIKALQFDAKETVKLQEKEISLKEALQTKLEITVLSKGLLQKICNYTNNQALNQLLEKEDLWKEYVYGRDLLDVVEQFGPFTWSTQQFVHLLRKIPPRLYSISSSLRAHEDEVHLTIGKVCYEKEKRKRLGVCSGQIAERIKIGDHLPIYIHKNPNFKLPKDDHTPIIMIGAGTGIAPFRAFVEDRAEKGVKGKSWLFFGDQHFVTDFLYQTEWQQWVNEGVLTKIDVAFSRDTDKKVYVQHRMQENAKELYEWIEEGAVIYVCGDEKTMAKDVDETLHLIIEQQGGKTKEETTELIQHLKQQGRYQRDVY